MGWVCSGMVFLGLGSLRVRATLGGLGSRECMRQYWPPARAPLRHGVPLPVTPWHGGFFEELCLRVATSWRSWVTSARRDWRSMGLGGKEFLLKNDWKGGDLGCSTTTSDVEGICHSSPSVNITLDSCIITSTAWCSLVITVHSCCTLW